MPERLQYRFIRLLQYNRAPPAGTREFRSWKDNADILPKLQFQLEMVLDAYGNFSANPG